MLVVVPSDASRSDQPAIERADRLALGLRGTLQIVDARARMPDATLIVVDHDSPVRRRIVRSLDTSVFVVKRPQKDGYRRPLIATDLDDATDMAWVLNLLEPTAEVIRLVHAYRIPFRGGNTLWRTARLEHELHGRAREDLEAFVSSCRIERARFELLARRGDARDVLLREIASSECDLAVIASRHASAFARLSESRLVTRILASARCDVLVVRDPRISRRGSRSDGVLLPLGPW